MVFWMLILQKSNDICTVLQRKTSQLAATLYRGAWCSGQRWRGSVPAQQVWSSCKLASPDLALNVGVGSLGVQQEHFGFCWAIGWLFAAGVAFKVKNTCCSHALKTSWVIFVPEVVKQKSKWLLGFFEGLVPTSPVQDLPLWGGPSSFFFSLQHPLVHGVWGHLPVADPMVSQHQRQDLLHFGDAHGGDHFWSN